MLKAVFFLPCHIRLFTNLVTSASLYFASAAGGIFLAFVFLIYRMIYKMLCWLFLRFFAFCSVLGAALLAVFNTGGIEATPYNVVTYSRKILHTTASYKNDRVF